MTQHARLASLHLYPVKGAHGIDIASADVGIEGLSVAGAGDREWMIVDRDGRFVSQRSHHQLAQVGMAIRDHALVLTIPGHGETRVALDAPHGQARDVVVWRSTVRGFDEGDAVAAVLSAFIGADVRLVRFDASLPRLCNPDYAGDSGAHTRYSDGYPLLVIGAASLDDLNERLGDKGCDALPMNRFRPNLVIEGLDAFDEDHIGTLAIGDVVLKMVKPCIRCEVTTIDQETAIAGVEPLVTLSGYRQHATLGGIHFGMNAIVAAGAGATLAEGDAVTFDWAF